MSDSSDARASEHAWSCWRRDERSDVSLEARHAGHDSGLVRAFCGGREQVEWVIDGCVVF
jgi:hypothetical protein